MTKHSVTFVDVSEVYHHLGFSDAVIATVDEVGFHDVTYGDADMTLVGNAYALHCIWEGLEHYHAMTEQEMPYTWDAFLAKYWHLVGQDDYINLEG